MPLDFACRLSEDEGATSSRARSQRSSHHADPVHVSSLRAPDERVGGVRGPERAVCRMRRDGHRAAAWRSAQLRRRHEALGRTDRGHHCCPRAVRAPISHLCGLLRRHAHHGRPFSPGGSPPSPMLKQPQANRPGDAQLPRRLRLLSARLRGGRERPTQAQLAGAVAAVP